jgi:soluble lytic murein transglycosylase-like protein
MMRALVCALVISAVPICWGQSLTSPARVEAEYYVAAYAQHYRVPVALVRAIVERESNWQPCAVSSKGAAGLMQLMPRTARLLGVRDRCNIDQNISGGVRYLAWLMRQFHNDLRLVAAAYYAGEIAIGRETLAYGNPDVISYVARVRTTYLREVGIRPRTTKNSSERDVR